MKYDRNTKMKKAKFICGVKPDKSEFYICAGMKLFGDFVGKSKDIIKNATKTQSTICGYYIIKLEYEDMIKQFEQVFITCQNNIKLLESRSKRQFGAPVFREKLVFFKELLDDLVKLCNTLDANHLKEKYKLLGYITYPFDENEMYIIQDLEEYLNDLRNKNTSDKK